MATLEGFDARSLALDFSPLLQIKQALDQNKNRALAERKLQLDEEIRRGTLDVAEADLILRQEAGDLAGKKFESEQTSQQSIQDTLSQLIDPTQTPAGQTVPGQAVQAGAGGLPAQISRPSPRVQPVPEAVLRKREKLLLKLAGTKGGAAISKTAESIFASRDERAKTAFAKEIEEKQGFALSLKRMDSRAKQDRAIDNEIAKQSRAGQVDPFLTELRNMSDADREQELFLDIAQGDVLQKLAENELTPEPGFTLSPGQERFDAQGKRIARVAPTPPKAVQETNLIRNIRSAGIDPESKEGRKIVKDSITKAGKPRDLAKELGIRIQPGFQFLDPNDPTKGVTPTPGGGKDRLTAEQAAKVQMLRTAKSQFGDINKLVFDKDGSLNRFNLFNANVGIGVPFTDIGTPGIPFTDGDLLRAKMEFGIQAITRGETGAAMPPAEVENTRIRFTPKPTDSKEIVEIKLQMYRDFINGSLKLIDPTGRFQTDRFGQENEIGEFNPAKFDEEFQKRVGSVPGSTGTKEIKIGRFTVEVEE